MTVLRSEPPLTPGGGEAHDLLRRELLHPDYHQDNVVLRLIGWLGRLLDNGLNSARNMPPMTTFAAMLVGLLVLVALVWLVSRARRTQRAGDQARPVLAEESVTADQLRDRADAALAGGRYADALVDAFRAAALRQVERDRIDDLPGATAHEVALALAAAFPEHADEVYRCAGWFDLVLYGGRPATREQAEHVLSLDDRLGGRVVARW